eukprot:3026229-Prymnesium_polylepis.1
MFDCAYSNCQVEKLSKAEIISCLHDRDGQYDALQATKPGLVWSKLGKAISKLFQTSGKLASLPQAPCPILSYLHLLPGLLFSDVTIGIEESLANLRKLQRKPGKLLTVFNKEYQEDSGVFEGNELNSVSDGIAFFNRDSERLLNDIILCTTDRFEPLLSDPVLKAFTIFEVVKWPAFDDREALESFGEATSEAIQRLLLASGRGSSSSSLATRTFVRSSIGSCGSACSSDKAAPTHFYHALLVVLIGMVVLVDTSICERGFSTMNLLKSAKRSVMGTRLLRMLMIICTLGAEWKDPAKIPAAQILSIWRAASDKGRYEGKLWQPEALEELEQTEVAAAGGSGGQQPNRPSGGSGDRLPNQAEAEVDATKDSGHFARWGEAGPQHRGEHAGVHLGTRRV